MSSAHVLAACLLTLVPACGPSTDVMVTPRKDMSANPGDLAGADLSGTTDDGGGPVDMADRHWTDVSITTGADLWSVWNSGDGTVLIVGNAAAVFKSRNGGAFMAETSMKPAGTPNLLSISSVKPGPPMNPLYVAGQMGSIWSYGGTLATGGGSFTAENTGGTTQPLYGVWVAPDGVAFAVGQETALKRDNGSWAPLSGIGGTDMGVQVAYNIWGAKTASGYTVYCVGNEGRIWHSNGGNFLPENSGTPNALYGVWGSGPNDIYVVGDKGTILHSTGDGTWEKQNSGVGAEAIEGIGGSGPNEIYAVGDNGIVLAKYDATATIWNREPLPNPSDTRDLFAVSATPSLVYVVGQLGAVLKK